MTQELVRRRLITTKIQSGQEILGVHRLLQCKILQELDRDPKRRYEVFLQAFTLVRKRFPRPSPIQVPDPSNWDRCKESLQHILSLRRIFVDCLSKTPPIPDSVEFSQLLYDAGFNCWEREMTQDGLRLLESAENILNRLSYDPHARLRADIHAIAGIIRDNVGISKKLEGLQQRLKALEIRKWIVDNTQGHVAKEDEVLLYNAMNDVAESWLQSYQYSKAAVLIEECRKQYQKWGTEEEYPFEYAKYYRNIGTVRMLQRRFDEAIECTQRALDLTQKDTGIGPRYLSYLYDMGCHVLQAGDKKKALELHLKVEELREEICGEYNDVTLQSCYTVGAMYHHLADMDQAE
jgi:tetratricopeptide (TPR) repeat protein